MSKSNSKKHSGTANESASTKRRCGDVEVEAYHCDGLIDVWFDSHHDNLMVGTHISPERALDLATQLLKAVEEAHREPSSAGAIKARAASLKAEPGSIKIGPFDEGTKDESVEFTLGSRLYATTMIRLEEAENLAFEILELTREMRRMPRLRMVVETPAGEEAAPPVVSADADAPTLPAVAAAAPRTPPNGLNGTHRFDITNGLDLNARADH